MFDHDPQLAAHLARLQPVPESRPRSAERPARRPAAKATGIVSYYSGFAYIVPTGIDRADRTKHIFAGQRQIKKAKLNPLRIGTEIAFNVVESNTGHLLEAIDLELLGMRNPPPSSINKYREYPNVIHQ
jgi:cold shock CspA family protein